ncbi:MAG: TRAP transporter TatT component family protein [Desulfobacteraceae bacterium]|nr:TRAP transporter TatT component family protein [Desulfobacteraceae bacterium]
MSRITNTTKHQTSIEAGAGVIILLAVLMALSGCSIKRMAVDRLGEAMAQGSSVYAKDDDPDLVGAALPFGLKTIEGLLEQSPQNRNLLLAASSGFVQYAYAFVQTEADFAEDADLARAIALRERAGRLHVRALGYGMRGLEVRQPGFTAGVRTDPSSTLAAFKKEDVPQLYWTAMALAAAISLNKTDASLSADLPLVAAFIHRALELDEGFNRGAIHDFLISYEGALPAAAGGSTERARKSLERAMQLSRNSRAAPLVAFAETVDVSNQDKAEFQKLLEQALQINPDSVPEERLANVIAQKRARWLLSRMDRLFLE